MITPHKYLNLDLSVIKISSLMLKFLLENKVISYNELIYKLRKVEPKISMDSILMAVNFLYLFGVLEFNVEKDIFELI